MLRDAPTDLKPLVAPYVGCLSDISHGSLWHRI